MSGFLFSFLLCDNQEESSLQWASHIFVRELTQSKVVHVAVTPVVYVTQVRRYYVQKEAYTTWWPVPFRKVDVRSCINPRYRHFFLCSPSREDYKNGIQLLDSLLNRPYPSLLCFQTMMAIASKDKPLYTPDDAASEVGSRTMFCSQAAMLLCVTCGLLNGAHCVRPSLCTPGDLFQVLEGHGIEVSNDRIQVHE